MVVEYAIEVEVDKYRYDW